MTILHPPTSHFKSLLLAGVLLTMLLSWVLIPGAESAKRAGNAIVIFQANWCANCRQVTPLVQEIGSQNGLEVKTIDVDFQDAPSQASNYGLSIPSADLPQVYLVSQGRVSLLLDGRQVKFVKPDMVRSQVLTALQQARTQ